MWPVLTGKGALAIFGNIGKKAKRRLGKKAKRRLGKKAKRRFKL